MKELLLLLGAFVLWIALNRLVLPWFGIQTCMSGGCAASGCPSCGVEPWNDTDKDVQEQGDQKPGAAATK
jgi:hypothetical protein